MSSSLCVPYVLGVGHTSACADVCRRNTVCVLFVFHLSSCLQPALCVRESLIQELCSVYECLFKLYMSAYLSVCESYS
jgi:hypothetical protein